MSQAAEKNMSSVSAAQASYPQVDANPDFAKREQAILDFWRKEGIFQQSIQQRPAVDETGKSNAFVFFDGPPFANGLPHYGHLLTGYVKDVFPRYQTMRGKRVERRFGWDCHGLPAEMGTEKELGISGRQAIESYGIEKFNTHCRTDVMKYTHEWERYVTRQARWVDFENDYKTMDKGFMESVLWAFKQLYDKGWVYEGYRVMPYSWAAQTPLSNFETRMDNAYRQKTSKAVTVRFPLIDIPAVLQEAYPQASTFNLLAWTTTPWTLPSNLALAANPSGTYYAHEKDGIVDIHASAEGKNDAIPLAVSGLSLVNLRYKPLFPYFANHPNAFRVLDGSSFIEEGSGTGIVHMAPGFGEDDQRVCAEAGIAVVCPVDDAGCYTTEIFDLPDLQLQGLNVMADTRKAESEPYSDSQLQKYGLANLRIVKWLKDHSLLVREEDYSHNYPHCWRTDTPLIYKAVSSWYVKVTAFKDRMVELNQQINWIPGHVKDGLFGKWLENAHDWSISRNRYWGAPIPVWRSDNPLNKKLYVFGSISELNAFFNVDVKDLHRPFIDNLTAPDPDYPGSTLRRVPEVLDCWFESGSMPFAQQHYPFENKETFEKNFPADFIVEYTAQTRGWFYTLMVLGTALFDKPPFLNCICHGVVLDANGEKLSKRLRNYPDPIDVFETFGADALRWFMMSSPIMRGQELHIDKEGAFIRDAVRLYIKPLWNAYTFFTLYANADGVRGRMITHSDDFLDSYILCKLREAVSAVQSALDGYDTPTACEAVTRFLDVLNNWYIRRSKDRFWKTEKDADKQAAYDTLYTVLHVMTRVVAPLLPILSEEIYQGLTNGGKLSSDASVHLTDWPDVAALPQDAALVAEMDKVRDACNAALAIRNAVNIRVRQPLSRLTLIGVAEQPLRPESIALIQDEVNVKACETLPASEVATYANHVLKLDSSRLGKKLGSAFKEVLAASKSGQWQRTANGLEIAGMVLDADDYTLKLEAKAGYEQQLAALSSIDALVMLDTGLTDELRAEGYARDMVRLIQQSRKDAGLNITDRIVLTVQTDAALQQALNPHLSYIAEQTLAETLRFATAEGSYTASQKLDDKDVTIGLKVAA